MLILFDVDGTILSSEHAGVTAMTDAGRELYGDHFTFDDMNVAGRLDRLIWDDLTRINNIENTDEEHDRFRAGYAAKLQHRLDTEPTAKRLPGVAELIAALREYEPRVTLGLLTGNYPETGRLKIERAGVDPDQFTICAWGIEGKHRRDLPPLAIERYESHRKSKLPHDERHRVVIIGDTPADIDCAKHNGCRVLAVATGSFTVDELNRYDPDLAVEDLSDTPTILRWLLQDAAVESE